MISLFLLCFLNSYTNAQAQEEFKPEEFKIDNGIIVYGYQNADQTPKQFRKEECGKYVFADENFTPLKNGRHIAKNGENETVVMIEDSCLLIRTGESKLADGRAVEFYETGVIGSNGNYVFVEDKEGYKHIYNEKLQLKNGKIFYVKNGYLSEVEDKRNSMFFGEFDGNDFVYEDRD